MCSSSIGAPFELLYMAFLKHIDACGSKDIALEHNYFLGISIESCVSNSNTMIKA